MRKNIYLLLATLLTFSGGPSFAAGKIQNADVKSLSELQAAGGTASQLINDSKIYVTGAGINKQLSAAIANGEIGGGGGGGYNLLTNAEFESGVSASWSNSGGTYGAATSTDILKGSVSAAFTASATGQYFESAAYTVPEILKSTNCYAEVWYKGGSSNLTLKVVDGTGTLIPAASSNLEASTAAKLASVNFICPSSGSIKLRVESTGSSALASFDLAYLGQAKNIVSTSAITDETDGGAITIGATTTAPTKGTTTIDKVRYHREGPFLVATYRYSQTSAGTAGSGDYLLTIPGGYQVDTSQVPVYTGAVNAADSQRSVIGSGTGYDSGPSHQEMWPILYSATQFRIRQDTLYSAVVFKSSTNGQLTLATLNFTITIKVPIQGWSSNTSAARADQTNYGWTSYTPTFVGLGTVTGIDCQHKRDASDLLLRCKGTAGTTTATTMSVSLPGSLLVSSSLVASIQKVGDFLRNVSTATTYRRGVVLATGGASVLQFARVDYNVSAAPLTADTGSNMLGSSEGFFFDARIPIEGWTENQKAPVLIGSVTSSSVGPERVERISVTNNGTVAIASQSGSWVSGCVRNSAGFVTCSIAAGIFASSPSCSATMTSSGVNNAIRLQGSATTSAFSTLIVSIGSSPAATDANFDVVCMGPR